MKENKLKKFGRTFKKVREERKLNNLKADLSQMPNESLIDVESWVNDYSKRLLEYKLTHTKEEYNELLNRLSKFKLK